MDIKKKLLSLLLLLPLVGGLSACGGGGETPSSASSSQEEASLTLSEDCPTVIELGKAVDIAPYINISPAGTAYTLEVKTMTVAVLGSTVEATALGAFKVTISAPSLSLSIDYEGTVISNEQVKIDSYLQKAIESQNYYSIAQVYMYDSTYGMYNYQTLTYAYHDDSYFAIPAPYWTDESSSYSDLAGLLEISGNPHGFIIDENGNLTVNPAKEDDLSYYSLGLALPSGGMSDMIGSDGRLSYIMLDDDIAETMVTRAIGFSLSTLMSTYYEGYSYGSQISYYEAMDGLLLDVVSGGTAVIRLYIYGIGETGIEELDAYVAAGQEPEPLTFDSFSSAIKKIRDENLSYTTNASIKVGYYMLDESETAVWHDATTEKSYYAQSYGRDMTVLEYIGTYWQFEPVSYTAYTDDEMNYSINNTTGEMMSFLPHEGRFYKVNGTPNSQGVMDYSRSSLGSSDSFNISSPFVGIRTYAETIYGYNNFAYVTDEMLIGNYSSVNDTLTGQVATNLNHGDEGKLLTIFFNAFPQLGYQYLNSAKSISSSTYPDMKWYDFLDNLVITYDSANNSITFDGSVSQVDGAIVGESAYYVSILWSLTISNIGSTTVPSDWISEAFGA